MNTHHKFYLGDSLDVLRKLPDESVHTCVTSPPYWGLRDYGIDGQMGLEQTPEEYVAGMVEVFREVRRVLRKEGTLWLNLGDSYAHKTKGAGGGWANDPDNYASKAQKYGSYNVDHGLKEKDLMGIPWRVAFALQADGWYLRSDIIWAKPNPMPESVTDRPTKAHEYIFLLSKSERYYYDHEAIQEPVLTGFNGSIFTAGKTVASRKNVGRGPRNDDEWRNKRDVWTIPTQPFPEAHFATFPPDLIKPCILAGCPEGGTVLDPFGGAGTTSMVAKKLSRNSIYVDLNPEYLQIALRRMEFDKLEFFATHTYEVKGVISSQIGS